MIEEVIAYLRLESRSDKRSCRVEPAEFVLGHSAHKDGDHVIWDTTANEILIQPLLS